jgi:acetyl esterase/lipase
MTLSEQIRSWFAGSGFFLCAFSSFSCVGPQGSYSVERDIVFTPESWQIQLRGDAYRPKAGGPSPAVLLIHGDGRSGDDGRWQMGGIARKLARRGYYVFNITYRMAPDWQYPAPLLDAREALAWMRANSEKEGLDPERIGTFGYSAGGYVASLVGMKGEDNIKAVVAGAAPSDLTYYAKGELIRGFLGGALEEVPELFLEASPVNHITPNSPPVFLYHGERDLLVHPDHAREMLVELEKYRVPHEIRWIPGKGHVSAFIMPAGATDAAIDFLDRYLK